MNILQILPALQVGGVETGTVDLSRWLVRHGHKSVVVSSSGELVKELQAEGGLHYTMEVKKKTPFGLGRKVSQLVQIIRQEEIDIVHVRSRMPGWVAFLACRKTGVPMVTTCHGYYGGHFLSRVMAQGKFVLVPSQIIGRHMKEDFGVSNERLRYVPRGVDLERFTFRLPSQRRAAEPTVAIIGRITPLKGHPDFLKAMPRVLRSFPHLKILIVGSADKDREDYLEELKTLTRRLGLSRSVNFLGTRRDMDQIFLNLSVLVFPSRVPEAFGRVIVEAQASGVPVVATRLGGILDVIEDDRTGLLVSPGDSPAISEAVMRLLRDRQLADRISQEARQKVERQFSLEKMASLTLKVYEEAVNIERILVVKLSAAGDIVLITPSLKRIREHWPKARIYCFTSRIGQEILKSCPYIDELLTCDPQKKSLRQAWRLAGRLRGLVLDKVIDFQNSRFSHLVGYLSLAPRRFGYKTRGKLSFLLSHGQGNVPLPAVEHQFRLLSLLGVQPSPYPRLEVWPALEDEVYVSNLLQGEWLAPSQKLVGFNISASPHWPTKEWPAEYIVRLFNELASYQIRVIMTGTKEALAKTDFILKYVKARPINACGKTSFMQLVCLIRHCQLFITPDSAPLHLAAAVGAPCIALFGPTCAKRHLPPGDKILALQKDIACAPCYHRQCRHSRCMKQIGVEEMLEAMRTLVPGLFKKGEISVVK